MESQAGTYQSSFIVRAPRRVAVAALRLGGAVVIAAIPMLVGFVVQGLAFDIDQPGPTTIQGTPSPGGQELAFASDFGGNLNLWITSLDGTTLRQLTSGPTDDREPAWSPVGAVIAFASKRSGNYDIWVINSDGSSLRQLTADSAEDGQPAWSPDGTTIAFVSDRGGSNDIWLMKADGTGVRRLTSLAGQENHPSFSPTGDEIVFSYTTKGVSSLMIVKLDGSDLRGVTGGGFRDWYPNWSAGGIVFSSNRSGRFGIWVVQPSGSGLTQIPNAIGWDPVWTRDGRVLFTAEARGSSNIISADLTGSSQPVTNINGFLVGIDIKPGGVPNSINPKSSGTVPVAILSTKDFDAPGSVDGRSLTFGRAGDERSLAFCNSGGEDVNGDGIPDLVCHFKTSVTGFTARDITGILRGATKSGFRIEGRDSVRVVPPK